MKAWELHTGFGFDALKQIDRHDPRLGPGQVLLRMQAWSLNYRDLMVVKGQYNPRLKFPMVPLSDGVGEVIEIGAGVTNLKVGERVAGCFMPGWNEGLLTDTKARTALGGGAEGMLAERVVLPAEGVVRVPEHLNDTEAATLPCAGVTAWNALQAGGLKAGDSVLIQGTGGVSLFALQFARLTGARVIATSSSETKLGRVLDMGASDGINYKTVPDWEKRVREIIPDGVDHVVEVGGAGTLPRSLKAVRTGGVISLIGVLSGGGGEINPLPILMRAVRVLGIYVGSRAMFEAMNRAIALNRLKPVVDHVFGFDEFPAALRHMESGSHFGKVALALS
jgi:NADPH:quinone reductase-like Zn-dependent oxidoreductase